MCIFVNYLFKDNTIFHFSKIFLLKNIKNIKDIAKLTIQNEMEAIHGLLSHIDDAFEKIVTEIIDCKGRVIITGIGKSANIGNKIVSTLNSTGTPAVFMHAADAIHGDLGIIQTNDIVICISKSGETPEIKVLTPLIKNFGNTFIAMVGNTNSYLAKNANYVINCTVPSEACPNNLAPTSSTTAQLVMGDALAVALLESRGFTASDFAKYHPGGSLGKQLYLKVQDLSNQNPCPFVKPNSSLKDVIIEISGKRLGVAAVIEEKKILGVITDGDLRRMLLKGLSIENTFAEEIMSPNPKSIQETELAVNALELMKKNQISQLLVVNSLNEYKGIIHLHDLLKEGIL